MLFSKKTLIFQHVLIISNIFDGNSQLSDMDGSQNVVNLSFYYQKKYLKAYFAGVSSFLKV